MQVGLGPAKGKDFATTLGPWIVTADELEPYRDADGFLDLWCTVAVNGVEIGRDLLSNMGWTFETMIAYASRDSVVAAGDVLGSGTVGNGGCLAELWGRSGRQDPPPLQPGDVVTLDRRGHRHAHQHASPCAARARRCRRSVGATAATLHGRRRDEHADRPHRSSSPGPPRASAPRSVDAVDRRGRRRSSALDRRPAPGVRRLDVRDRGRLGRPGRRARARRATGARPGQLRRRHLAGPARRRHRRGVRATSTPSTCSARCSASRRWRR